MHTAKMLIELGSVLLGLSVLGTVATRFCMSPIPLYLLGGLAFGRGGLLPLDTSDTFIRSGADVGLILLLLTLGLEYSAEELLRGVRRAWSDGLVDLGLNAAPAAVGAFLVGLALSGEVAENARAMLAPLRNLFSAVFFLFFGLEIDPAWIPAVAAPARLLAVVTGATKMATGWWVARHAGLSRAARIRAGATLIARGEFSIVIAGLSVDAGLNPGIGPFAATYVLLMAIIGPLVARYWAPMDPVEVAAPLPSPTAAG